MQEDPDRHLSSLPNNLFKFKAHAPKEAGVPGLLLTKVSFAFGGSPPPQAAPVPGSGPPWGGGAR